MKNLQQNIPHYKNKNFRYAVSILAIASVVTSTSVVNAATFSFSFTNESNETGSVEGKVQGIIELPDGDGTFAATSVVITSAPTQVLSPDGANFVSNAEFNSFQVFNSEIIIGSTLNFLSRTNDVTLDFFGQDLAILTNEVTGNYAESSINSVNFAPVVSVVSTPEPTSIISLLGVSVLGVVSQLGRKDKKSGI